MDIDSSLWSGRNSENQLYLHEKVTPLSFDDLEIDPEKKSIAFLGYACDEGVRRNQGRPGAVDGPNVIRKQLAKMPNHLTSEDLFFDSGDILCPDADMEAAQMRLSQTVSNLLKHHIFPIVVGGGHDISYGHFNGIKSFTGTAKSIGIINFDAHFDLRNNQNGNNSGTPFLQIAHDRKNEGLPFHYMCLGVRKDANDKELFQTASDLGASYLFNHELSRSNAKSVVRRIMDFIREVDHVYTTIDLDGFSSAIAPGVSAPSPMGFTPPIVLEILQMIVDSKKLISLDVAEMNPKYDNDNQTAKLAASLIHFMMHAL